MRDGAVTAPVSDRAGGQDAKRRGVGMSVWRHLTHPDGMTVSLLVAATGLSAEQVRAELRALEQDGKACRERAPIGKESHRDNRRPAA